jgi:hypothetical protein
MARPRRPRRIDLFVGLGFLAAGTSTVHVMTYLTVVSYRNPFLLSKSTSVACSPVGGRSSSSVPGTSGRSSPLWLGGNAKVVRERVAACDG